MSTPSDLGSAGSDLSPMNFDQDYVWNKANMIGKRKKKKELKKPTRKPNPKKPNTNRRKKPNNKIKSGVAFLQRH